MLKALLTFQLQKKAKIREFPIEDGETYTWSAIAACSAMHVPLLILLLSSTSIKALFCKLCTISSKESASSKIAIFGAFEQSTGDANP